MAAERDDLPAVLFVAQGTPGEGEAFFERFWPEARAVSDTDLTLFTIFGIHHSDVRDLMKPDLWLRTVRTTLKGHFSGQPQGDVRLMPGMFLVQNGRILWEHPYRHAGDHPDFDRLPEIARTAAAGAAGMGAPMVP